MVTMKVLIPLAALDDGASTLKAGRRVNGRPGQATTMHSLVSGLHTRSLGASPRMVVTIDNESMLVGSAVLSQDTTAAFDTSDARYMSRQAAYRGAAALAWIVQPEIVQADSKPVHAVIDELIVGSNVEFHRGQAGPLIKFFQRTWEFKVRDTEFTIEVRRAIALPQPMGAWHYVRRAIPETKGRRYSVIDPGRFSTDIMSVIGDEIVDSGCFAIRTGVQAVADTLRDILEDSPETAHIPTELNPLQLEEILVGNASVTVGQSAVDLTTQLHQARQRVWSDIRPKIDSRLHRFNPELYAVVSGGGLSFRDPIMEHWKTVYIPPQAQNAVLLGYMEYGRLRQERTV